jgi:phosphoribosylformylglycinamidine synthase
MELEVINPEHEVHGKMLHNESHKHESIFTSVTVQDNKSVMLSTLAGSTLVWFHTEKENSTTHG